MKTKILGLTAVFLTTTMIAAAYLLPTAYAINADVDEDFDVGETGSWTWAYIKAYWPPRYFNFYHDSMYNFAPGYWGPPADVDEFPRDGNSGAGGWTKIELYVWQGDDFIERIESLAHLPDVE